MLKKINVDVICSYLASIRVIWRTYCQYLGLLLEKYQLHKCLIKFNGLIHAYCSLMRKHKLDVKECS